MHHDLVDHYGISVSQMTTDMLHLSLTLSSFMTFITGFVIRLTRRVSLMEQLSSPPLFSGIRVNRSLILSLCFVDRHLSFCSFSFVHCVVCSSSIYGLWLVSSLFLNLGKVRWADDENFSLSWREQCTFFHFEFC